MKKLLILPAIIGIIAVPSLAMAQRGADDGPNHVRQEDRSSITKPTIVQTPTSTTPSSNTPTSTTPSSSSSSDDAPVVAPAGSITADAAKAIAQSMYPDKTFAKLELEQEHGALVYEIKFTDDTKVQVLASNGTVVRNEVGDDDSDEDNSNSGRSHVEDDDSDEDNSGRRGRN